MHLGLMCKNIPLNTSRSRRLWSLILLIIYRRHNSSYKFILMSNDIYTYFKFSYISINLLGDSKQKISETLSWMIYKKTKQCTHIIYLKNYLLSTDHVNFFISDFLYPLFIHSILAFILYLKALRNH